MSFQISLFSPFFWVGDFFTQRYPIFIIPLLREELFWFDRMIFVEDGEKCLLLFSVYSVVFCFPGLACIFRSLFFFFAFSLIVSSLTATL